MSYRESGYMTEEVIKVTNLGKKFRLRSGGGRTLKSAVIEFITSRLGKKRDFWALKDVSFSVRRGETLGIIGVNGAGKSTLLSILAGVKVPTEGSLDVKGKVSSLLELGAGFHPDLTGRENVYLYGAIMGLSRKQISSRMDAVVKFAGIGDFIDQPVKHYSSGMYVRLGFSVAVEVNPDILLIDEVLAVGDTMFQRKCLDKMKEFRREKKTKLIISHDIGTIKSISDRILVLDGGTVKGLGDPENMAEAYSEIARGKSVGGMEREWGTGEMKITGVDILNAQGEKQNSFSFGDGLTARIRYSANKPIENPVFGFAISDASGKVVYGNNTQIEKHHTGQINGEGSLELKIGELRLARGDYTLSFSAHSEDHTQNYHRLDNFFPISVKCDKSFEGCYMPCEWRL